MRPASGANVVPPDSGNAERKLCGTGFFSGDLKSPRQGARLGGLMHAYRSGFAWFVTSSLTLVTGCSEDVEPRESAVMYVAAGTRESSAFAGFLGNGYGASRCETSVIDRCYFTTCLDGGGVQTYVDGGKVDFEGDELEATLDTGAVEDSKGNPKPGLAVADGLPVLEDEETIAIKVRGKGSVPAIEGSIELPPRLVLSEPELEEPACQGVDPDDVTPVTVDVSNDFRIRWSSEREDDVDILFWFDDIKDYPEDDPRERSTTIRCLYRADEETAVIPEELLEAMPSGRGSFSVRQIVKSAEVVDNWTFTFGAYWELCSPIEVE